MEYSQSSEMKKIPLLSVPEKDPWESDEEENVAELEDLDPFERLDKERELQSRSSISMPSKEDGEDGEDEVSIHLLAARSILSRLVEPFRFIMQKEDHEQKINEENLLLYYKRILRKHKQQQEWGEAKKKSSSSSPMAPLSPLTKENVDEEVVFADVRNTWRRLNQFGPVDSTYGDMLKFDMEHFPVTTSEEREKLFELAKNNSVVTRKMVANALGIQEGGEVDDDDDDDDDDWFEQEEQSKFLLPKIRQLAKKSEVTKKEVMQTLGLEKKKNADGEKKESFLLQSIFHGCQAIPGPVLREQAHALSKHPKKPYFALVAAEDMVRSHRNMATYFPFAIIFCTIFALLIFLDFSDSFTFSRSLATPIEDDWQNYCTGGPNGTCEMIRWGLYDVRTTSDVERFVASQAELIYQLWGPNDASTVPFRGSWLVGSILIRMAPAQEDEGLYPSLISCAALNLTEGIDEILLPQKFSCGAIESVSIPFSSSKQQAVDLARSFRFERGKLGDSVTALQFGAFRPSDGKFAWVTISFSLPQGGSVVPRVKVVVMNSEIQFYALIFVILQFLLVVLNLITAIRYRSLGHPSLLNIGAPLTQQILITIAWVYLLDLEKPNIVQTEYMDDRFEKMAASYFSGLDFLGVWVLFYIGLSVRYLRDLIGFGLIFRLLKAALGEIGGLLCVFGVVYVGFVAAAMVFFGGTESTFAAVGPANANLMQYFWGSHDFGMLTEQSPRIGAAFFYSFNIFVSFFALNLLIAVLTAPLNDVREAANLHLELYQAMAGDVAQAEPTVRVDHRIRTRAMPLVSLLADSCFFLDATGAWLRFQVALKPIYGYHDHYDPIRMLYDVRNLLKFIEATPSSKKFDTLLARSARKHDCIPDHEAFALLQISILQASNWSYVQDAHLVNLLLSWDNYATNLANILEKQEATKKASADVEKALLSAIEDEARIKETLQRSAKAFKTRKRTVSQAAEKLLNFKSKTIEKASKASTFRHSVKASELQFAFNQFVVEQIKSKWIFPLQLISVLVIYLVFLVPILNSVQPTGWMNENVHSGLRDYPYLQRCLDPECRNNSLLHEKTLADTAHIYDLPEYLELLYGPNMFPPWKRDVSTIHNSTFEKDKSTVGTLAPVYWDKNLRRGNITLRQLRAKHIPCAMPSLEELRRMSPSSTERIEAMMGIQCYDDNDHLETRPMLKKPADSPLPDSAYEYQFNCREIGGRSIHGWLASYPCEGYSFQLENIEQLQYIIDYPSWIDNATRLFVVTQEFYMHNISLEYSIYWEIADGGGTVLVFTYASPVTDFPLSSGNWIAYILLGFEMFMYVVLIAKYYWAIYVTGNLMKAEFIRPNFPFLSAGSTLTVILCEIIFSNDINLARANQTTVLIIFVTGEFLEYVLFPIAIFFLGTRASAMVETLKLAIVGTGIVLPFYFTYFIAFTFSGHIIFGSRILEFSSITAAASSVGRGLLTDWNFPLQFAERPNAALLFSGLFFVVVLTVLANLLLSLITAATEEARAKGASVKYVEDTNRLVQEPMYTGPLFVSCLCWCLMDSPLLKFIRIFSPKFMKQKSSTKQPMYILEDGRVGLFRESLWWLPSAGCFSLSELLQALKFDCLPESLVVSTVLFVAQQNVIFMRQHQKRAKEDEEAEKLCFLQNKNLL